DTRIVHVSAVALMVESVMGTVTRPVQSSACTESGLTVMVGLLDRGVSVATGVGRKNGVSVGRATGTGGVEAVAGWLSNRFVPPATPPSNRRQTTAMSTSLLLTSSPLEAVSWRQGQLNSATVGTVGADTISSMLKPAL